MMPETEDYLGANPEEAIEQFEQQESVEEPEAVIPFVEELPPEEHIAALENALPLFGDVLKGVKDYTIFSSTALYLQGKMLADRGFQSEGGEVTAPPGDLDIAVQSEEAMQRIVERLRNIPGVELKHDGRIKRIPNEDGSKFAGSVPIQYEVDGEVKTARYEFEVFHKSNIVTQDVLRGGTMKSYHGLNILSLDALQRQYERNEEVDRRVNEDVQALFDEYLESDNPEIRAQADAFVAEVHEAQSKAELSEKAQSVLDALNVPLASLQQALAAQHEIKRLTQINEVTDAERKKIQEQMAQMEDLGATQAVESYKQLSAQKDQAARANVTKINELIGTRSQLLGSRKTKQAKRAANKLQAWWSRQFQ